MDLTARVSAMRQTQRRAEAETGHLDQVFPCVRVCILYFEGLSLELRVSTWQFRWGFRQAVDGTRGTVPGYHQIQRQLQPAGSRRHRARSERTGRGLLAIGLV